ncbi:MAG: hypothetical protein JSR14_07865 [Proteobacteria bacterium]|nr:hypothetical protein [Pseudomonadota bacterium]
MNGPQLMRAIEFGRMAADISADTAIPCTIATQTPVHRYGVAEVLDCSATGVDLSRSPLPLIVSHDAQQLSIGLVENLRATGDRVVGEVRFASSPEAQQVRADVLVGIHRSLSVGYAHLDEGAPIEGGLMYRWQPYEVSIVSVPADPQAGFFRSSTTTMNTQDHETINDLCTRHGFPQLSRDLNDRGASVEQARAAILEAMDVRDQQRRGGSTVSMGLTRENPAQRALIENTLVAAFGGRPGGDVIRSTDLAGLAVRALEMQGVSVSATESRDRIIQRAMHTTSDFPALLGSAVGRVLHAIYAEIQAPLKTVARLSNLQDFRARSVVRLGGAPSLERVNESGEFTYGSLSDTENGWRLTTYGRILALSRQAMVNDDLQGFSALLQKFAQAAARREADELAAILLTPSLVDGSALFHADRSSLIDKKLTLTGLGDAVKALRLQKEEDGGLILQEPANLVVPVSLEMAARQLVASFAAVTADTVQPYSLNVVVEPRLDASSAAAWYLVAGNQTALEYGYLDGAQGVQITQREGFEVDGLEVKARLDFGCGWVSPIGWVKSSGTVA